MTAVRMGVAAAARCLALDQLAAEVITALQGAGIQVVLLKGAGLARRLYPDNPDQRRYSDVDLLVAPSSFDQAQDLLAALGLEACQDGFRAGEVQWHERLWRRPGAGSLAVDLHRSFAGVGDAMAFWETITAATEPMELSGAIARVPDAGGCALVVGLHAARPGRGRKALTDLVLSLALLPDQVWDRAAGLARLSGSTSAFARGLSRDPTGVALCQRLNLQSEGTLADELAAEGIYGAVLNLAMLSNMPGLRSRLRHIISRLAPSPAFMRYVQPLARRGMVGLTAAYVVRWGWILGQAPRAALAFRHARRNLAPQRRPRHRSMLRAVRAAVELDGGDRLTCLWTLRALHRTRRQIVIAPLADLDLASPPAAGRDGSFTVERVLAHRGANCMETALVTQRWLAGQGIARDLVIGVSAPGESFYAHAWLHDPDGMVDDDKLGEIHRRPPPAAWLMISRSSSRVRRRARN